MNYNDLPIYEMLIEDGADGMTCVSLTSSPAIQVNWMAFNNEERPLKFSITDEEEHKVLTPICRADFPIYRRTPEKGEFMVVFSKDTIAKMAQKFLKDSYQSVINVEHLEDSFISGVELEQLFIKNSEKGINPKGFEDIEEGSLFGQYKIENPVVWDAIKQGLFTSVSLEGTFNLKHIEMKEEQEVVLDTLEDLEKYITN